jgi:aminomethyltransferase
LTNIVPGCLETCFLISGKRRRAEKDFPGAQVILRQLKEKPTKKRVGIVSMSGPPARAHTDITDADTGVKIGEVTSGCPAPSLPGANVSMGYVETKYAKAGTKVKLIVRKKEIEAEVSKMPFVPAKYFV